MKNDCFSSLSLFEHYLSGIESQILIFASALHGNLGFTGLFYADIREILWYFKVE